jgi:hypothetical protein
MSSNVSHLGFSFVSSELSLRIKFVLITARQDSSYWSHSDAASQIVAESRWIVLGHAAFVEPGEQNWVVLLQAITAAPGKQPARFPALSRRSSLRLVSLCYKSG